MGTYTPATTKDNQTGYITRWVTLTGIVKAEGSVRTLYTDNDIPYVDYLIVKVGKRSYSFANYREDFKDAGTDHWFPNFEDAQATARAIINKKVNEAQVLIGQLNNINTTTFCDIDYAYSVRQQSQ